MLSTWLLIQPSEYVKERTKYLIQRNGSLDFHPLMLHFVIISASEKNWREYLNDVQEELNELVCFFPSNLNPYSFRLIGRASNRTSR